MKPTSIGKLRGLQQISSKRGTFTALALDHRQNLRKANPAFVNDEELSRFKLDVTSALAPRATAVLLDPEVSAAQAIAQRAIPHKVGLVVAVESTGYTGDVRPHVTRRSFLVGMSKRPSVWAQVPSSCWSITIPIHPQQKRLRISLQRLQKIAGSMIWC
jgi:tagatose-1,6-bisphosphate aldolase